SLDTGAAHACTFPRRSTPTVPTVERQRRCWRKHLADCPTLVCGTLSRLTSRGEPTTMGGHTHLCRPPLVGHERRQRAGSSAAVVRRPGGRRSYRRAGGW